MDHADLEFLRSVPLFGKLAPEDIASVGSIVRVVECRAGEVLFRERDAGDRLYVVRSGSVAVRIGGEKPVLLDILREGEFFGEMALIDGGSRSATVSAQEDARLLALGREDFLRLVSERPSIAYALVMTLVGRVREMHQELLNARRMAEWYAQKRSEGGSAAGGQPPRR